MEARDKVVLGFCRLRQFSLPQITEASDWIPVGVTPCTWDEALDAKLEEWKAWVEEKEGEPQ